MSKSPFHTLARILLIATICGGPWAFGAVQPWAWAALMTLSVLTLILWAAGCAHCGVLKIVWSPLYWPFLAFLALAVVQLFTNLSYDHVATREAVVKIVTDFNFFFLAGQLLNTQPENGRVLDRFGLITTLLAVALCLLGIAQMLWSPWRVIYWTYHVMGAPFGPYVNHNNYAGLMEMLLPISIVYILSRSMNIILQLLLWSGVSLVIISIWISGSRGASIVLVIEGLLLAGILLGHRSRSVPPRLFVVLLGVVLVSAVGFSLLVGKGSVTGRSWGALETGESLQSKLGDRWLVAIDTLHLIRSHPGMGIGVGCFEYAFPSYLTFTTDLHWTHAHDDVLEAVAETGLPGFVLILVAITIFIRSAFRDLGKRLRHGWGWIQMGATLGAVGLFCHSFVDFNLRVPANATWFVVCLAIATHSGPAQKDPPKIAWDSNRDHSSELLN